MYDRCHHLLSSFYQNWLSHENLMHFCQKIIEIGAPLVNCWGFVDGTLTPIKRPGMNQRSMYNGHKRVYGFKFHSIQKQPPRLFSKISVLFFQEHLFLEFSWRHYVFTKRMPIFQEGLFVHGTDTNFTGGCGLFTKQILFFQEPSLCVHRTDNNFPGAPFLATDCPEPLF